MKFSSLLIEATLLKRYKRFLADVALLSGKTLTIHCPNTGSMQGCDILGSRVWFSTSDNPKRKYPNTWEIVEVDGGSLVGINTGLANRLVREAIDEQLITELQGYEQVKQEVKYGQENSRIDFLLTKEQEQCYVEVKNVTLGGEKGIGYFPDAITLRGSKHLRELIAMKEQGHRAVILYCVQHTGINEVHPADHIDPIYGKTLRQAMDAGVEVLAYRAKVDPVEIILEEAVPVVCP